MHSPATRAAHDAHDESLDVLRALTSSRLQDAHIAMGDETSAHRLAACGKAVMFIVGGELVSTDQGEVVREHVACSVPRCPWCSTARYEQHTALTACVGEAGGRCRSLVVTVPQDVGPRDLYSRFHFLTDALRRLFASASWLRLVGKGVHDDAGWFSAIEPKWTERGGLHLHAHILTAVVVARERQLLSDVVNTWSRILGKTAVIRMEPVRTTAEQVSRYVLKGVGTVGDDDGPPPHLHASDSDLRDLVRLSIGSGSAQRKVPARWCAFHGAWWGRPKPAPRRKSKLKGRRATPRHEFHDDVSAGRYLATRLPRPVHIGADGQPTPLTPELVFEDERFNVEVPTVRWVRVRRRRRWFTTLPARRDESVVRYAWVRDDHDVLVKA